MIRVPENSQQLSTRRKIAKRQNEYSPELSEQLSKKIDLAKQLNTWIDFVAKGFAMLARISDQSQSHLTQQFKTELIPANAIFQRICKKINKINDSKNIQQLQVILSILSLHVKIAKELSSKRCTCRVEHSISCVRCQIFEKNSLSSLHLHKRMLYVYQAIQQKIGFRSEKIHGIMEFVFNQQPEINQLSDRISKQVIIRSRKKANYKSPLIH